MALVQDARYRVAPRRQGGRRGFSFQRQRIALCGRIIAPNTLSDIALASFNEEWSHISAFWFSKNFSSLAPSSDAMLEQVPRSSQPAISAIGSLGFSTTSVRKNAQYSPPAATQPNSKMRPHGTLPDLSA